MKLDPYGSAEPTDQVARVMRQLAHGGTPKRGSPVSAAAVGPNGDIGRALPELVRLIRYEKRAVARRDRAIRNFLGTATNGDRTQEG